MSSIHGDTISCVSRMVDRRFVLGDEEREHFRMLMRMRENFRVAGF